MMNEKKNQNIQTGSLSFHLLSFRHDIICIYYNEYNELYKKNCS